MANLIASEHGSFWKKIVFCILTILVPISIVALHHGGPTWDEILDFEGVNGAFWHGVNTIKGLNPSLQSITFDLEYFGNATRWITYLFWRFTHTPLWESFSGISRTSYVLSSGYITLNHLNAIFFGFLGLVFTGLLAQLLSGKKAAVISICLLMALPAWLGHSWMNSKDIPFATSYLLYTLSSTLIINLHLFPRTASYWRRLPFVLKLTSVALLAGSRISSIPFLVISEAVFVAILINLNARKSLLPFILTFFAGLAFALFLTPQGWSDPFGYPFEAISFISSRQSVDSPAQVFFYIGVNLFETIPLVLLLGIVLLLLKLASFGLTRDRFLLHTPLLLQLLLVPALLILTMKTVYSELRHIMFIYPAITIFSASGYCWAISASRRNHRALSKIILGSFAILYVFLASESLLLTPYQYVYKSELARISSPKDLLRRDYWGYSFYETMRSCMKNLECSGLAAGAQNFEVVQSAWNPDLAAASSELIFGPSNFKKPTDPSNPLSVLYSDDLPDKCVSSVTTRRYVLFPQPASAHITGVAACQAGSILLRD